MVVFEIEKQIEIFKLWFGSDLDLGAYYTSPLRYDRRPGCFWRIYVRDGVEWLYFHDYADQQGPFSVFYFVYIYYMRKGNTSLSYSDAVSAVLLHSMGITPLTKTLGPIEAHAVKGHRSATPIYATRKRSPELHIKINFRIPYGINQDDDGQPAYDTECTKYFARGGISLHTLREANVFQCRWYTTRQGKRIDIRPGTLAMVYVLDDGNIKIYRPFNSRYKFYTTGDMYSTHTFGDTSSPVVVICSSTKDALTLCQRRPQWCYKVYNSETSFPPIEYLGIADKKRILICFDMDAAGKLGADRLQLLLGHAGVASTDIAIIQWPYEWGKDLFDVACNGLFHKLLPHVDTASAEHSTAVRAGGDDIDSDGESL
ncbi:MAG: hypothetical protein KatS3mg054_0012 [Chloroflexus sp.]|nr:MAG: hypothetical protein KatS3mg054_0012 [Chloroflexus sp.]